VSPSSLHSLAVHDSGQLDAFLTQGRRSKGIIVVRLVHYNRPRPAARYCKLIQRRPTVRTRNWLLLTACISTASLLLALLLSPGDEWAEMAPEPTARAPTPPLGPRRSHCHFHAQPAAIHSLNGSSAARARYIDGYR
jgi:hypothetical protein